MTDIFKLMAEAPASDHPGYSDYVDALEAYTEARKKRDKVQDQLEKAVAKAEGAVSRREADLAAVIERLRNDGDDA